MKKKYKHLSGKERETDLVLKSVMRLYINISMMGIDILFNIYLKNILHEKEFGNTENIKNLIYLIELI